MNSGTHTLSTSEINTANTQIRFVQLVIETISPMAIYSGQRETGFDNQIQRDINGLPYIPASAIAGVWQQLAKHQLSASHTLASWFGSTDNGAPLYINHGKVLDSKSQPVPNFISEEAIENDTVLRLLANDRPMHRERVAINDRGVAKDTGKFDQIMLPKGVRFQITIQLNQDATLDTDHWHQLLSLWEHRLFCFGASTRNGLGRFKVVASRENVVDLVQGPNAAQQLNQVRRQALPTRHVLQSLFAQHTMPLTPIAVLPIKALDNWRYGTGSEVLSRSDASHSTHGQANDEREPNILMYTERSIQWTAHHAQLSAPTPVLCGSSIKGILAHRLTYHYRRLQGVWAESLDNADPLISADSVETTAPTKSHRSCPWNTLPEEVRTLLGYAADHKNSSEGLAGSLWVEDCTVQYQHAHVRQHTALDQFTGGVRQGALFSEELLYQPEFTLTLSFAHTRSQNVELSDTLTQALEATIEDLEIGLLPMGAGSGRGTSLVMKNPTLANQWTLSLPHVTQKETATA
ncbi:RAMP superfamily CRISPR-associated protein [Vibrio sp.]|nr:RAMP superfamily CRISPR-associated protein [Vibrio sp.]